MSMNIKGNNVTVSAPSQPSRQRMGADSSQCPDTAEFVHPVVPGGVKATVFCPAAACYCPLPAAGVVSFDSRPRQLHTRTTLRPARD